MKNNYDKLINQLQKNEIVPDDIFNKVVFSIQNNQAKRQEKRPTSIFVALSPLFTSIIVLVLFFGINGLQLNKENSANQDLLLQMYSQSYSDKYIFDINEEFLF